MQGPLKMTTPPKNSHKSFADAVRAVAANQANLVSQQTGYIRSSGKSNGYLAQKLHELYESQANSRFYCPPPNSRELDDFMVYPGSFEPPIPYRNPTDAARINELGTREKMLLDKIERLEKIIYENTERIREIEANHKDELIEMQDRIDDLNTQLYLKDV